MSINLKENNRGKNTVTWILIIAFVSLILRSVILQIIQSNITQNESNASVTLKFISTALENYAKNNHGIFPTSLNVLSESEPPYLNKNYLVNSIKGYNFSYPRLDPAGYSCLAVPIKCNVTGRMVFTITTGGIIVSEECFKKE
ncbi:MAG: hypothetical protein PHN59_02650 [Candidatus Omnitrophica bacterium]|nr:hypothetical protein [Candidatus Omnitrophota bacterium]